MVFSEVMVLSLETRAEVDCTRLSQQHVNPFLCVVQEELAVCDYCALVFLGFAEIALLMKNLCAIRLWCGVITPS